jgi:hypothetical protein
MNAATNWVPTLTRFHIESRRKMTLQRYIVPGTLNRRWRIISQIRRTEPNHDGVIVYEIEWLYYRYYEYFQ